MVQSYAGPVLVLVLGPRQPWIFLGLVRTSHGPMQCSRAAALEQRPGCQHMYIVYTMGCYPSYVTLNVTTKDSNGCYCYSISTLVAWIHGACLNYLGHCRSCPDHVDQEAHRLLWLPPPGDIVDQSHIFNCIDLY